MNAAAAAPDVRELAERLAVAERRIERLSEILADVLGDAVREPSAEPVRPRLRVVR